MKKKTNKLEDTAVSELHFTNMQVAYLLGVLDELETFCGTLELAVIKNAKERHYLDKCIHAKIMFDPFKNTGNVNIKI
jgi:hypothetical protein